jgi:tRNA-splicing ligase RtcB
MISGKILKGCGWPEGRLIGAAKTVATRLEADGMAREEVLAALDRVRAQPDAYVDDPVLGALAMECLRLAQRTAMPGEDRLLARPIDYGIWGEAQIDAAARLQMDAAMRLPISVAGALMPDAHVGYGLPIGGVLATTGAVIPFAVGVDIACFTGDTRVALLDGRNRSLADLARTREEVVVYSCTPTGRIVAAHARAMKTGTAAALVQVTLDNGERLRCTHDHEFMLRDGSYAQAKDLTPGTSLMPLYQEKDKDGYTLIQQNYSGRMQKAHWIVARSGLLGPVPRIEAQRTIIHHKDFDESNNHPSNLEFMGDEDHSRFHRSLVERNTHWQSPEFEQRRKAALAAKAQTPEGHAYFATRGGSNLKRYWTERPEAARAACAGNGQRGKQYLIKKNQSDESRAKSGELAARVHQCETCGASVKSYIGLHNHRRLAHGYNHAVVGVTPLEEGDDVYCLSVPVYGNFALEAGVFVHNCRMRLSIYPEQPILLRHKEEQFSHALLHQTQFGAGAAWHGNQRARHAVLDDPEWQATKLLRSLKDKAQEQLGTSGTGNHFVEWGVFTLTRPDPRLGLEPGEYLALLSHSGSRGVGFKIANTFSKLAEELHPKLDKSVRHLAWLPLDAEAGQEYWLSMELAGRFASANHYVIHHRVAAAAGLKEIAVVENFHNFAWRETITQPDGTTREAIVHRKGATPAGVGVLGVIPGSMGDGGYVVRGRGETGSLLSAAHGAGRAMSRRAAQHSITKTMRDQYLRERGVSLLEGSLDEAPQAYKPIEQVIAAQADLVEIIGTFMPRLVRMAHEPGDI